MFFSIYILFKFYEPFYRISSDGGPADRSAIYRSSTSAVGMDLSTIITLRCHIYVYIVAKVDSNVSI